MTDRQFYTVKPPRPDTTTWTTPTSTSTDVRKSWRFGTFFTLHGWRCHTSGSRSITTINPCCLRSGGCGVTRYNETTEDRDTTTDEPDTLHKTNASPVLPFFHFSFFIFSFFVFSSFFFMFLLFFPPRPLPP